MMQNGVPDLGQKKPTHVFAQLAAIPAVIPETGLIPLENGVLRREQFMDAADLLRAIRLVVKEELEDALRHHSLLPRSGEPFPPFRGSNLQG